MRDTEEGRRQMKWRWITRQGDSHTHSNNSVAAIGWADSKEAAQACAIAWWALR
jgi:hypothetical protein